jgi:hypothetical protein
MKFILFLFALPFLTGNEGCGDKSASGTVDSMPACIKKMTESENLPVQVDEYEYESKKVFLVTADCCDQFNTVYDENCNAICSPSGGLEGNGDRKCPAFDSTAKHIKKLWEKKQ